jgi:hypothetical protein
MGHANPIKIGSPGRITVGTAASPGPNVSAHGFFLKTTGTGQTVFIGVSSAVSINDGYPVSSDQSIQVEVGNLNQLWFIGSAASIGLAYLPYTFK